MLILDIPRRSPENFAYVDVPLYHRVHLSLAANIPVHACLVAGASEPHLPELVVSPFEFSRWDRIWRLNISLQDRPGLLHEVCDILGWNEVNILSAETSTMEEQKLFYVEMILESEDEHQMKLVEWSLLCRFCEDVKLLPTGKPRFRIHRLHELWHAKKTYEHQRLLPASFAPLQRQLEVEFKPERRPREQTSAAGAQGFRLRLPSDIREVLKTKVRQEAEDGRDGYYLRLSDTKDRLLRVLFFRINDPVIHFRTEYRTKAGALTEITRALEDKGFSILTAYVAPSGEHGRSRLEVVARCFVLSAKPISEIKARLEATLRECSGPNDLQIAVGYPRNYSRTWEKRQLEPIETNRASSVRSRTSWAEELVAELTARHEILYSKISHGANDFVEGEHHRWALVHRLIHDYEDLVGIPVGQAKSLFVSCHYQGNQLDLVERLATERGFRVFTGRDLLKEPTISAGLLNRLKCCSHFLGVWSREGSQQCGEEFWPSSWLLWEFGVAEAFGLEWQLLIAKGIADSAWRKIAAHRQHATFDFDFETKVKEVLDVLWSRPATRAAF